MRGARWFHAGSFVFSLCLSGSVVLVGGGCGNEDKNTQPAAPATTQAQQDNERAAREKAFGKAMIPGKNAPK